MSDLETAKIVKLYLNQMYTYVMKKTTTKHFLLHQVCERVYLMNIMTWKIVYKSFESIISNAMSKVIVIYEGEM